MRTAKAFTGSTRAERLAAERERFILSHIRPPRLLARADPSRCYNLWNFLLLLYWVFFKPSALRLYIARAAPELNGKTSLRQLWHIVRHKKELRCLVQQTLFLMLTLPMLIDLCIGLFVVHFRDGTFNWLGSVSGVIGGLAWVITLVIIRVGASGLAWGISWGIAWGIAWGVAGGIAWVITRDMAWSFARNIAWGLTWSIAGSLAWLAVSVTAWFIAWIIARGITKVVTTDIVRSLSAIFSIARIPLYLITLLPALGRRAAYSIVTFDELLALPVPFLPGTLAAALRDKPAAQAWRRIGYTVRQPAQRWAVQRACRTAFAAAPARWFIWFDQLTRSPVPYIAPTADCDDEEKHREANPYFSTLLILSELGEVRAIAGGLAQWITTPLRAAGDSPLIPFCRAYYHLLNAAVNGISREPDDAADDLTKLLYDFIPTLAPFRHLPHEAEITRNYELLARALEYTCLDDIAALPQIETAENASSLHPNVAAVWLLLREVSDAVRDYQQSTSEVARRDHLIIARAELAKVQVATAYLPQPNAALFAKVAAQWDKVIAAEQESVATDKPTSHLDNFYVAGPPLRPGGHLFIGRDEIFRRIGELWHNPSQKATIVLYGQRRVGKTSILNHLPARLGDEYCFIMLDMQYLAAGIENHTELLRRVGNEMSVMLARHDLTVTYSPNEDFPAFLRRVDTAAQDKQIVLVIDGFEMIEQKLAQGKIDRDAPYTLRAWLSDYARLLVIFAVQHLSTDNGHWWKTFGGDIYPLRVGCLSEGEARQLILNPWDGFRLSYAGGRDGEAVHRLLTATGGQPLLLQAAGAEVVNIVNAKLEQMAEPDNPTATLADVKQALHRVAVNERKRYFAAQWEWFSANERAALLKLARGEGVDNEALLNHLEAQGTLIREGDEYHLRIGLFRRWLEDTETSSASRKRAIRFLPRRAPEKDDAKTPEVRVTLRRKSSAGLMKLIGTVRQAWKSGTESERLSVGKLQDAANLLRRDKSQRTKKNASDKPPQAEREEARSTRFPVKEIAALRGFAVRVGDAVSRLLNRE